MEYDLQKVVSNDCFNSSNSDSLTETCLQAKNFSWSEFIARNPQHFLPEPLPTLWVRFICLVYVIVILTGALGNSTVMLAICRNKKLQSIPYIFLFSLAICNLLTAALIAPFTLSSYVADEWVFGEVWCKTCAFLKAFIIVCTIFTLTVISVDR